MAIDDSSSSSFFAPWPDRLRHSAIILLAGMLLFRVLYYITPFVISVILLTLRELILGARSKRLHRIAQMAEAKTRVEPRPEAVYVRERSDGSA